MRSRYNRDPETGKRMKAKHPLLQYCALGWARHGIPCGDSKSLFIRKVVTLFGDRTKAMLIADVLHDEGIYSGYSDDIISPLHIYTCLGLRQLVMHLVPRPGHKVTERFMCLLPRSLWKRSYINSRDHLQHTALSLAIQASHTDLALYLIDHPKVNVNIPDLAGRCPLSHAAGTGNVVVARRLLKKGAKHNRCDFLSRTPLSYAASKNAIEVVELLLSIPGSNPDIPDHWLRTPLSYAASANAIGTASLILKSGNIDMNSKDEFGQTPLCYAASAGAVDFVKLLLDTGKANLDMPDDSGRTPLSHAAEKGEAVVAKLLLELGADVHTRSREGRTPLSFAVEMKRTVMVKLLSESGAGVDV
jgi:ankyrin repeat protein